MFCSHPCWYQCQSRELGFYDRLLKTGYFVIRRSWSVCKPFYLVHISNCFLCIYNSNWSHFNSLYYNGRSSSNGLRRHSNSTISEPQYKRSPVLYHWVQIQTWTDEAIRLSWKRNQLKYWGVFYESRQYFISQCFPGCGTYLVWLDFTVCAQA